MNLDELKRLLKQATPGPWQLDSAIHDAELLAVKHVSEHGMNFYIAQEVGGRRKGKNFHDKSECVANAALIAALRNHAEELVRDARRMEWAEKHMNAIDTVSHPDNLVMIWHGPHESSAAGRTLRAAIDAAIAQEQPNSSATLTGSDEGKGE